MPSTKAESLQCMSCGAPISSGFFCARCQSGEEPEQKKVSGPAGSRFSGAAKKQRQKELLKEDLAAWTKRILILAVIGGLGFAAYYFFGDDIKAYYNKMRGVTSPHEKYDPTKDSQVDSDDQGQANGHRAFSGNQNQ